MSEIKTEEMHRICQRRHNGRSLDEYSHLKLLPHINEEYQFRITNKLLVQKIANPRRDKIIMDSLAHTSCSQFYKNKNGPGSHQEGNSYRRKLVLTAARKKRQKFSDSRDWGHTKQEQVSPSPINPMKTLKRMIQKNEERILKSEDESQFRNNDLTVSKIISMNARDDFVGKIVRNESSYAIRPPKRTILKGNYCLDNTYEDQPNKQVGKGRSQQVIKRIARRIYQDCIRDKQN